MLDGRVLGASQVEYKPFGKPPLKREKVDMEELEHMPVGEGQDALEQDARALLETFESGRCCRIFCPTCPCSGTKRGLCGSRRMARGVCRLVRRYCQWGNPMHVEDTALYPLLVLLQASSWTTDSLLCRCCERPLEHLQQILDSRHGRHRPGKVARHAVV